MAVRQTFMSSERPDMDRDEPTTRITTPGGGSIWSRICRHAKKEKILFKYHAKVFLYGALFQYIHSVAHNLAYYLHMPKKTLYDLGFALLPALNTQMQIISEVAFFIMFIGTILWVFSPFYHDNVVCYQAAIEERRTIARKRDATGQSSPSIVTEDKPPALSSIRTVELSPRSTSSIDAPVEPNGLIEATTDMHSNTRTRFDALHDLDPWKNRAVEAPVYFVHVLSRFFAVLVFAQTLRIICFLVTSLPGPNYHCRPFSPYYDPPTTLKELLFRQDAFFSCGDLVFSSHTTFIVMCALTYWKYGRQWRIKQIFAVLVLGFGLLVISARKHYSLDVVIAMYVVPLIWIVYDSFYPDTFPKDLLQLEYGQHGVSLAEFLRLVDRRRKSPTKLAQSHL